MKHVVKKSVLSAIIISSVLTMYGCGSKEDDSRKVDTKKLTSEIAAKYAKEETVEYKDKKSDVSRDKGFDFDVSSTALESFKSFSDNWNDIIRVYRDSSLTQQVAYKATASDAGVTISPYRNPVYALPDEDRGGILFDQGEWNDWGNAQQYYMVTYYNLDTGEKLAKPSISLFSVKTEISETPQVDFYVSDKGVGGLRWNKVKDAKEYAVVLVSEGVEGKSSQRSLEVITTTKDTKWEDSSKDTNKINWNFRTTFGDSFDTYYEEQKANVENGTLKAEDLANTKYDGESEDEKTKDKHFAVIAINTKGTSKISNLIDKRMCANQVPVELAYYMNEGGIKPFGDNSKVTIDRDIMLTSTHAWIVMADGTVTQKLVNYNTSKVKEDVTQYVYYEEDENGNIKKDESGNAVNYSSEDVPCLSIPFTIEGTSIKGYAQILKYDKNSYKKDLKSLKSRQENLRDRTGDIKKEVDMTKTSDKGESADKLYNDYNIYASNALSEYLALQMLNGQTRVNMDEFKEAMDQEYLLDAWYEAVYQNPLVLGVKGIAYDAKSNDVIISYDQESSTQREKQVEIKDKVKEITNKIIKDEMSDLEKETAINDYLCANAEYDDAALENAEKNNFKKVDEKFNDSFTSYGILVNGKGVCAGYAGSFKLLADEAGLKNIVVTGYLQGSMPHAWNRVNLENEWYTLDTTNNDNDLFANGLFNLSDTEALSVLNEDDLYAMNTDIANFKAIDSNMEFYRVNNKFYSKEEIVAKLSEDFQKDGKATYRTDVNLSEDEFYQIAQQVMTTTGYADMRGGYFMGLVHLTK